MNTNYIGENIKIYRERLNLTQQELADKIGKTWEMISRYERGVSSPLNQLDTLSKALKIEPVDLLKDITENNSNKLNRIPLFVTLPIHSAFDKSDTFIYYNAPDWVVSLDSDVFAIDMNLIDGSKGLVYVSPNSEVNLNDLVLVKKENGFEIENVRTFKGILIIGKILAKEIRY